MGISVRGLDFHDAFAHFEDRDVEGAAAKIEDGDFLVFLLVETVGERRRGGLVNESHDFEPGYLASIFRRLALAVVEVGRNGDDGSFDFLT